MGCVLAPKNAITCCRSWSALASVHPRARARSIDIADSGCAWHAAQPPFVIILPLASCSSGRLRATASRGDEPAAAGRPDPPSATGICFKPSAASTGGLLNFRAQSIASSPSLVLIAGLACLASSNFTISTLGRSVETAHTSGVMPRTSCASGSEPASSSSRTGSSSPFETAMCSAVTLPNRTTPFLTVPARSAETAFTSTLRASSVLIASTLPWLAAAMSGVADWPTRARAFASAPAARSSRAASRLSTAKAAMSGVTPTASAALTPAPFDSRSCVTAAVSCADEAMRRGCPARVVRRR